MITYKYATTKLKRLKLKRDRERRQELKASKRNGSHLRISGNIRLYSDKRAYNKSGHSILGALEYDQEEDKLKCHECGGWFKSLGHHAVMSHSMMSVEYRHKHGLRPGTALVNEALREKKIQRAQDFRPWEIPRKPHSEASRLRKCRKSAKKRNATPENLNSADRCYKQCLIRLKALARDIIDNLSVLLLDNKEYLC